MSGHCQLGLYEQYVSVSDWIVNYESCADYTSILTVVVDD
jgi:hypothetical protein